MREFGVKLPILREANIDMTDGSTYKFAITKEAIPRIVVVHIEEGSIWLSFIPITNPVQVHQLFEQISQLPPAAFKVLVLPLSWSTPEQFNS